jgi:hypothetical protein
MGHDHSEGDPLGRCLIAVAPCTYRHSTSSDTVRWALKD